MPPGIDVLALAVATLAATIRTSVPLIYASLGGMFSERSGVMNIALEGMMLVGAFVAVVTSYFTHDPWLGLLTAILAGGVMGLLLAWISVDLKADQVVGATAINILAVGATNFLLVAIWHKPGQSPVVESIGAAPIPWLSQLPVVGQLFGSLDLLTYGAFALVPLAHYILFRTPWGIRTRAVGEHPLAAETTGISVRKTRYLCVVISGMLAGVAGGYLSVVALSGFTREMTEGRGFIALGTMIFGKWRPFSILAACLLFGFADSLQWLLQSQGIAIPSQFLHMLPYALTIVALTTFIGRSIPSCRSREAI